MGFSSSMKRNHRGCSSGCDFPVAPKTPQSASGTLMGGTWERTNALLRSETRQVRVDVQSESSHFWSSVRHHRAACDLNDRTMPRRVRVSTGSSFRKLASCNSRCFMNSASNAAESEFDNGGSILMKSFFRSANGDVLVCGVTVFIFVFDTRD